MNFGWHINVGSSLVKKKKSHSGSNVDPGEGYAYARAESIKEMSVPSPHFCCEPKTSLKHRLHTN